MGSITLTNPKYEDTLTIHESLEFVISRPGVDEFFYLTDNQAHQLIQILKNHYDV